jgi:hypothetical protein
MNIEDLLARLAIGDVIQTVAVIVALAAAIIALVLSAKDRATAREIAAKEREQAKLIFELEQLLRLLENRNRGGSPEKDESARLGAEALTLVGMLGPDLLPEQWSRQVEKDDDGLRAIAAEPDFPQYKKDAIEVQIAMNATMRRLREVIAKDGPRGDITGPSAASSLGASAEDVRSPRLGSPPRSEPCSRARLRIL